MIMPLFSIEMMSSRVGHMEKLVENMTTNGKVYIYNRAHASE